MKPIILGIQPLVFGGCNVIELLLAGEEVELTGMQNHEALLLDCMTGFCVFFGLILYRSKESGERKFSHLVFFSLFFLIEMHRNDCDFLCAERKEWLLWRSAEPCG